MMAQIRAFAKSLVAKVLLGILLISFVVFGVGRVTTQSGGGDEVVKVGARPAITSAAFRDRFTFFKQELEQQNQQPISTQEAVQHDLDRRVADELATAEAFSEMLRIAGLRAGDALIAEKLRTIRALFNPITGAFDKAAYEKFLRQNNLTAAEAERDLGDEITEHQFVAGMAAGLRSPLVYSALQAAYVKERRDFSYFTVAPTILGPPIKPTDAEMNAFIRENAQRLMNPERRQLSLIHVSAAALQAGAPAPEADVEKRFAFEKETLSTPEKRTFAQIPVKDAAAAAKVIAQLKAGVDPSAAAKSVGSQAIPFIDQPKAALPDKAAADAAFALKPSEVSGPVQGGLGLSVIKLDKISPGHEAALAEARPRIEAEVKKAKAEETAYNIVQKYDQLHAGGADMAAAAKAVNVPVEATPPVDATGAALQGKVPPKVIQAAFAQAQGMESEPISLGQGEWWVVRVDKILPPAVQTLEEIRPKLTQYLVMRDAAQKLQARATALQAAVRKGETLEAAAASVGASVQTAKDVTRNPQGQTLSEDLLAHVFQAKPGEVVVAQAATLGFVVAKLDKISPAEPAAIAPIVLAVRQQTTKSLFNDLGQDTRLAARALVKVKVDYARARKALGVEAPTTPDAGR
jgi:peptidyl-prolyl cis-trans isomerase D